MREDELTIRWNMLIDKINELTRLYNDDVIELKNGTSDKVFRHILQDLIDIPTKKL